MSKDCHDSYRAKAHQDDEEREREEKEVDTPEQNKTCMCALFFLYSFLCFHCNECVSQEHIHQCKKAQRGHLSLATIKSVVTGSLGEHRNTLIL